MFKDKNLSYFTSVLISFSIFFYIASVAAEENISIMCVACHTPGVLGAPKTGDKKVWQALINKRGIDSLANYVKTDKTGAMPHYSLSKNYSKAQIVTAINELTDGLTSAPLKSKKTITSTATKQTTLLSKQSKTDNKQASKPTKRYKHLFTDPLINQSIKDVADSKALCGELRKLSDEIDEYKCEYMTDGRYREFGRSKMCGRTRDALKPIAARNESDTCRASNKAYNQLVALFPKNQESTLKDKIWYHQKQSNWTYNRVKSSYNYPFAEMNEMRENAKLAQERGHEESHRQAWSRVVNAAKSPTTKAYDNVSNSFKEAKRLSSQVMLNDTLLNKIKQRIAAAEKSSNASPAIDNKSSNVSQTKQQCSSPQRIANTVTWIQKPYTCNKEVYRDVVFATVRFEAFGQCNFTSTHAKDLDRIASSLCKQAKANNSVKILTNTVQNDLKKINGKSVYTYERKYQCGCP